MTYGNLDQYTIHATGDNIMVDAGTDCERHHAFLVPFITREQAGRKASTTVLFLQMYLDAADGSP
jgi:hypothetical protein